MLMSRKVCIAGKGRIAINALNEILRRLPPASEVYAVFNATEDGFDHWQPSFMKFVQQIPSVKVTTLSDVAQIEDLVFLSMEFDRIIKPDNFKGNPRIVNMHFSLLPAYKGMFTSALPILNGEAESGCTLHLVDPGIDTGDIIAQTRFRLAEDETCKTLYEKYVAYGSALFADFADRILSGTFEATSQSARGSTYYSKKTLDYSRLSIDWNQTAEQVVRQMRAYNHRSYQLPTYDNQPVAKAFVLPDRSRLKPGRLVRATPWSRIVATIDYDVELVIDEFETLISASRNGDTAMIRAVIDRNPSLMRESSKQGWTALMVAAFEGSDRSVEALLELGANANQTNQKGTTPLMYAKEAFIRTGNALPSRAIIRAGGNIHATDMWGKTVTDYLKDAEKRAYLLAVKAEDTAPPSK
jgi:methionyl-tRNA formyltransferase